MAGDRSHVAYKEAPAMDNGHDDSVMIAKSPAHKRRRLYLAIIFMILLLLILLASGFLLGLLLTGGLSSALNTSYKPTLRLTDHVTPQTLLVECESQRADKEGSDGIESNWHNSS